MAESNTPAEVEPNQQDDSYDTSDPKAVNNARKKSARTRADRLEFIKAAMSHEQGRSWFYDILVYCKLWDGTFLNDPYESAFVLGKRNVGLRILDDIQTIAPSDYLKMVGENKGSKG